MGRTAPTRNAYSSAVLTVDAMVMGQGYVDHVTKELNALDSTSTKGALGSQSSPEYGRGEEG